MASDGWRVASKTIALFAFAWLVCLAFAGCQRTWVKEDEIPGTWAFATNSRQLLSPTLQSASAILVFKPDKTFAATGVPAEVFYGTTEPRLVSGSGQWALTGTNVDQIISLSLKTLDAGQQGKLPADSMLLYAGRKNGVVTLYYFIGDPDLGRRVVFERK